ncbi:DUF4236 domain-containing protein [Spirosoma lituiforme]
MNLDNFSSTAMAWSYRKRIKIIPGVHLNLSKRGISTSIGVKGANVTFNGSGAYLNTSVPGLGLYNRHKLSGSDSSLNPAPHPYNHSPIDLEDNIFSADIQEITSQNMQGVKETILLAQQQRKELKNDLLKTKAILGVSKLRLVASYVLLYGLVKKSISENIKSDIGAQKEAINRIQQEVENSYVNLDIEFDPEIKKLYETLTAAFRQLTRCAKIWDVTSAHHQDRRVTRSSAGTVVKKREVSFSMKSLLGIKSDFEALCFNNANGADLYFYPCFVVMYSSKTDFAIIGLDEISLQQSSVRFTETGTIPKDSKIIDKTWAKVNKNGTPDKRFKGNYQIPVVRYGEISLSTATGLNEEYEFSNYEFTEEFGKAFRAYQATIRGLKHL